jgi:hypothetical protein
VLVMLLGFMPLIVIHWADRRPRFRVLRPRQGSLPEVRRLAALAKAVVLVWLADNVIRK